MSHPRAVRFRALTSSPFAPRVRRHVERVGVDADAAKVETVCVPAATDRRIGSCLSPIVSAEPVALIPQCEECNKVWLPTDGERWEARWIDDGPEEKLVFYCPECAEREFDGG
jgi:hypothetical protein